MRELVQGHPAKGLEDFDEGIRYRAHNLFIEFELRVKGSNASDYFFVTYVMTDLLQGDENTVVAAIPVALERYLQILSQLIQFNAFGLGDKVWSIALGLLSDGEEGKYGRNGKLNSCGIFRAEDPEIGQTKAFLSTVVEHVPLKDLVESKELWAGVGRVLNIYPELLKDMMFNIKTWLSLFDSGWRSLGDDEKEKARKISQELVAILTELVKSANIINRLDLATDSEKVLKTFKF